VHPGTPDADILGFHCGKLKIENGELKIIIKKLLQYTFLILHFTKSGSKKTIQTFLTRQSMKKSLFIH
jgi:hypothetical protein